MQTTTIVPFPLEDFNQLKEDISFLRLQLSHTAQSAQSKEWLTRLEFMEACSIGSTTFNIMRNAGKLTLRRVSNKLYVHHTCVDQYFSGGTEE